MRKLNSLKKTKFVKSALAAAITALSFNAFAVDPLTVSGNKVLQNGSEVSLPGMSMFWSNNGWIGEKFYNAEVVGEFGSTWDAKVIRAAMGVEDSGGYFDDSTGNKDRVKAVVDAAIAQDMYVIIDWHSHHAHEHDWDIAKAFFEDMATTYGANNNIIYEIYNEPLGVNWSLDIKPYAEYIISAIRAIDPDNLIVVGTPNWSQDVDVASTDPISGTNIAYTLHYYSASHGATLRAKAELAMANGIALFVTEQGNVDASGAGSLDVTNSDIWYQWLKDHKISFANWSVNNKNEAASTLVCENNNYDGSTGDCLNTSPKLSGWTAADLTASGTYLKDKMLNWDPSSSYADHDLPGTVQAEDYHAASDSTSHNEGSPTSCTDRGMGVDSENTSDSGGGCNVGWTNANETITYNIGSAGSTYDIRARLAGQDSGKRVQISVNGSVVGTVTTSGGGWQTWSDEMLYNVSIPTNATVTVEFLDGGANFNYMEITESGSGSAPNLLSSDGTFASGQGDFGTYLTNATASFSNNDAYFDISSASTEIWEVQMTHNTSITNGQTYTICYDAWAGSSRTINVNVDAGSPTYAGLMDITANETVGGGWNSHSHTFTATGTESAARLVFNMGQSSESMSLDNVGLYEGTSCGNP